MTLRRALACAALVATARVFAARYEILVGDPSAEPNSTAAFAFVPDLVNATRGDTISFVFAAPWSNHRVVQGRRAIPCSPAPDGFDSGWRPVGDDSSLNTTFNVVVQSSAPIYFICLQPDGAEGRAHCIDGMVGAVNAAPASLAAFRDSAARLTALPVSLTSGESKATPTATPSPSASAGKRDGGSKIAVGVTLAFIGAFLTLLWCFCRQQNRKLNRTIDQQPILLVATHTETTRTHVTTTRTHVAAMGTHVSMSVAQETAWRLDVPFVDSPVRPPPPASVRQRGTEEQDLPRYEDRRADVLLDEAAPAPAARATTREAPPPDYARS
ncbi:hypothetical protein AURDEDRAFT_184535 [Auricularia subglabra TFB-10046 SS5]|nr:hypothetical protein AURDEDRAFT_184535 [Auricularia subglabra TFB-10046 SS5]